MKKKMFLAVAAMMATMSVSAQDDTVQPYIPLDQMPHLINIMPAPPAFESPEFANDVVRYAWGRQQREDAERVALAIADAEWENLAKLFLQWKDAFGLEINETATPQIYKLMVTALATTDPMRKETKAFYNRQRPFERFYDTMPSHEEDDLRGEGSYPSGHSLRGWTISLLLAQIAPERADQVFARGWDYCNSRVILGAHWQSDVDASRAAASVGFCALQSNEEFLAQMKMAQQEYKSLTGVNNIHADNAHTQGTASIYHIDGTPATEHSRGVLIADSVKRVK